MRRIAFFAAAGAVTAAAGWALPSDGPNGVFVHIQQTAGWLNGGPKPAVVTWPAWGYAWLVALAPSLDAVVLVQAVVGALALTALAAKLWHELPAQRGTVTALLLLAVPWHSLQVSLYPHALAGSFALLALLALDRALAEERVRWAFAGGFSMALAQNFRTEFVLLPAFLALGMGVLAAARVWRPRSFTPVWAFAATALVLQLPWAAFYRSETGRWSLTESNFGHVLYLSLGSRPDNPWGVDGDDRSAQAAVEREGFAGSSLSDEGGRVLRRAVRRAIAAHPAALAGRTAQQLKNTVMAPFNWGEPRLDPQQERGLDALREELKSLVGIGVNVRQLAEYRQQGLYEQAKRDAAVLAAFAYLGLMNLLGSAVFLLGLAGIAVTLRRAGAVPAAPILILLASAAVYKVAQDVLLAYQVHYLNNVYPMFVPFASLFLSAAAAWWTGAGRRRPRGRASAADALR